jgi:hypothetical protein
LLALLWLFKGRELRAWLELAWLLRRPGAQLSPREATLTYRRLLKTLARKGFRKSPAQTPSEFASSLAAQPLGPAVAEFTALYHDARFGARPPQTFRLLELLRRIQSWKPQRSR